MINKEQIDYIFNIRENLCLAMADIGYLLGVSRDEIYSYLDSKNVSDSILLSLKRLSEIADLFEKENIEGLNKYLDRPLLNSPILIEFLKDELDKAFINKKKINKIIKTIKDISEREKENRAKVKGSGKNLRPFVDVIDDFNSIYNKDNN